MGKTRDYQQLNALVSKAVQGDKRSFDKLCELEAPQILYFCTRLMGNTQDGEDAAQEVFIYLQKKLHTLQMPEMYVSWMQKMIYNVCSRLRRNRMKYSNAVPIEELADMFSEQDDEVLPEAYLNKSEKRRELLAIIDGLPEQIRSCIAMYYMREMKIAEIAQVMDISEGSVKGYLYVGREKLRKALRERDAYLKTSALVPMSALTAMFQMDMQATIAPSAIRACLKAAGAGWLQQLKWAPLAAAKSAALAAAATLAAVTTLAVYTQVASSRALPVSLPNSIPQGASEIVAGGQEDMAADNGAATPETAEPGLPPSGPGGGVPALDASDGQNDESSATSQPGDASDSGTSSSTTQPSSQPSGSTSDAETPAPVSTRVSGRLTIVGGEGAADTAKLFSGQYYATIEQDGLQLAWAMVADNGKFTFSNLAIAQSGRYTLRLRVISNYSLAFTGKSTAEIDLTPGQTYTHAAAFTIKDDEAPVVALSMLNAAGEKTAADPASIMIDAYDLTRTSITWVIHAGTDGAVQQQGSTARIGDAVLGQLSSGLYTVHAEVSDALGNTTAKSATFYIR